VRSSHSPPESSPGVPCEAEWNSEATVKRRTNGSFGRRNDRNFGTWTLSHRPTAQLRRYPWKKPNMFAGNRGCYEAGVKEKNIKTLGTLVWYSLVLKQNEKSMSSVVQHSRLHRST
jgi:hypothetical protein